MIARIFLPVVSHDDDRKMGKLWLPMMMITPVLPPYCSEVIVRFWESGLQGHLRFNQSKATLYINLSPTLNNSYKGTHTLNLQFKQNHIMAIFERSGWGCEEILAKMLFASEPSEQ